MKETNTRISNNALVLLAIYGIIGCRGNQPSEKSLPSRWIRIEVAEGQDASNALLTLRDFKEIKATVPMVQLAVPELQVVSEVSSDNKIRQQIVSKTLADAKQLLADARTELVDGQFFNATDVAAGQPEIVISQPLAKDLFPNQSAVGNTVSINDQEFRIIGVLGKPNVALHGVVLADIYMDLGPQPEPAADPSSPNSNSSDQPATVRLDRIWIKVDDLSQVDPTIEILRKLLSSNHPSCEYTLRSELSTTANSTD
ncbi:ABC transporter permease [Rubripirellula sp.]|nr:ABC transporter permease [Rubripirellula sp.]